MRLLLTATVLSALLASGPAGAQSAPLPNAWKWRDASGQIHVSDVPPPQSVPAKDILDRPPLQRKVAAAEAKAASAASAVPVNAAPRTDPELEARRKRAAEEQAALQRQQQEKDAAIRTENCSRARGHLAALADGQRLARSNAQGEREVLDDKGRAEEMQRARAVIASDCR
ncbi:MAG: DUF4124 domain-containing protein [Pseudomonadota bacterium]